MKENFDLKFNDIFKEAEDISLKLNIEPKMLRICKR